MRTFKHYLANLFFVAVFVVLSLFIASNTYAVLSWPGDSGSVIGNALNLGDDYEPSGLAYHSRLNKLVLVGDDGDITTLDTNGTSVDTWPDTSDDLEGVAIADPSTSYVYVGVENPDGIKSFNLETEAYAEKEWDLTPWMTDPGGQGLEALTFVPNDAHPYSDSSSGGLFYAGLQYDGKIYVFDINLSASGSVTYIDTITVDPALTDISGLDYNSETGLIYAIFDTANELVEMNPDGTIINRYTLPGDSQEGITIVSSCPTASANVYVAEDSGEVWAYSSYPVVCLEEDGEDGGDDGDNGDDDEEDGDDDDGEDGDNDDGEDGNEDGDNGENGEDGNNEQEQEEYFSKNAIITVPGKGNPPDLRTFNKFGQHISEFSAYNQSLKTGFNIDSGDLNGDHEDEIIVAPRQGGGPHILIFDKSGNKFAPGFFAYSKNIRCGVDVTTGDLNDDDREEIITVPGEGCPAHVRVFNYKGEPQFTPGFYAYNTNITSGFRISASDLNNDGKDEIVTSPEKNMPAHIRIFNQIGQPQFVPGFYAYNQNLKTGADVTSSDLNGDGKGEIITIPGDDYPSQVRIFNYLGKPVLNPGFYAYDKNVKTGFNISSGDLNNDRKAEIVVSPKNNAPAHIRIFNYKGLLQFTPGFYAYEQGLSFGADVALGRF